MSRKQKQEMLRELMDKKKLKDSFYALSAGQKGLWFLQKMKPESYAYNVPCAYRVHGLLDVDALKRAFQALMDRHPILRTVIKVNEAGEPLQSVSFKKPLFFQEDSIADLDESELEPFLRTLSHKPFDLETGPLFRVYLFSRSQKEHILLVNIHHIIFDGSSSIVFLNDLMTLYKEELSGEKSTLPDIGTVYADYVKWQEDMLVGNVGKAHLNYWLDMLAGDLPVLNLPADTISSAESSVRGCEVYAAEITSALSDKLRKLAKDKKVTLFTVLLSAFKVLLYRYTQQDDIITGIPTAGRTRTEFENLIGFFINTLPVRTHLSDDISFEELMQNVHKSSMGALEHQDYPFPEIVKEMKGRGRVEKSDHPVFQTSFVFQNWVKGLEHHFSGKEEKGAVFRLEPMLNIQQEEDFDLALEVVDVQRLLLFFKYDASHYRPRTISDMSNHFKRLVEGISENPAQKISRLPLIPESTLGKMLVTWNDTKAEYPEDKCIHQLFEKQVERTPGNVAILFKDERLTYKEVNERANQLGRYLQNLGVGPDTRVGICMDRSANMIMGLLGILKAGGAYVPLDAEYPQERLAYMLEDTKAPVLLTERKLKDSLPAHGAEVVCLDSEWPVICEEKKTNIEGRATPDHLAYIIYTSGSTGKPKGVMIRHRGLPNLCQAQIRLFGVEPTSRVLQFASLSFDASISEIAMALCSGATLCLASRLDLLPGENLKETLIRHAVTHVTLPPTALSVMSSEDLTDLTTIIVAGEACPSELAAVWSKHRTFINAYGPTEYTVCASGMRYDGQEGVLHIGKPIDNTQLYILDRLLQPVPIGVPGELHIGGHGLALGYLNRPDLTKQKFIPNPFGEKSGSRIYKTGDLCRWLSDGNIEFLGRMDHQVKIRGFRVELGEIEAALREHSLVREAVVITRADPSGNQQLTAYFVPEEKEKPPEQNDLRRFLKTKLPDFMIPAPIVALEAMPLTPNGKIDRKALPAPDRDAMREHLFVSPENETQTLISSIWKEVLGLENVSVHDDFFAMGGHSLLAIVVVSRIQKQFSVKIPVKSVFDFPTLSEFGDYMDRIISSSVPEDYDLIQRVNRNMPPALSFAQQRLWFLDKFEGGEVSTYNTPLSFRATGPMDISALNSAVNEIIRRHEVLRTVFRDHVETPDNPKQREPEPVQIILPELKLNLSIMDISDLPAKEREARARQIASEEGLKPFDLSRGPLIRAGVVRLGSNDHLFLLTTHHIVFDGWSAGIFLQEFGQLYGAFSAGKPSPLLDFEIQYADFSHWQRENLSGVNLKNLLTYWEKQLAGVPLSTELPTDRPRPPVQTFNGDFINFELGPSLTSQLNELSHNSRVTLFMTLYATFAVLLSRYTGKEDIVIGSPTANRNHLQTEHLIGFFVNTLALRTDLSGDPAFSDLLDRVKTTTLDAYEHQDLPFERLVVADELNIERSMSHSPLFQVMFDLHNATERSGELAFGDLTFVPYEIDYNVAKFDLTLSMLATVDNIEGKFQYNTDLFDRATIHRTVGHFKTLLADVVTDPGRPISELAILPQSEKHRLVVEFNDTKSEFPEDKCIHQLFEEMATRTPDAVAVVFNDQRLTYKELNDHANQVGHYLQKLGVGPDVLVGICMERSLEMIVGVFGILKAGGAYVPLDPSYPKDRISYMLGDTKSPIILIQSKLHNSIPESAAKLICLDSDWETIAKESQVNVISDVTPDHLVYVIYTSGTTGKPKGVMIEHKSVCARMIYLKKLYRLSSKDIAIHYRPYSFDGSIEEYLLPLLLGARFVIAPSGIAVTDNIADYLINAIEKYHITKINMPPVLLDVFLTELEKTGVEKVKSLHIVISGGDKLTKDIVVKFISLFNDTTLLYNTYGPTENTNDSLNWQCNMTNGNGRVLIGKAIANTQAYILDKYAQLLPIGVPGELHVGGVGLARGYLNRPNLTKEMFIPNPFADERESRLYKTGDLCRCLPDGNIEFLGRVDHQVKIRGFRIELGEIESVMSQHGQVQEAVVIAREDQPGHKQLAAYITPASDKKRPEQAELREFLKTKLPDYMIPAFIIVLDSLPLTPNGKINRKVLPAPERSTTDREFAAPQTENEKILAKIWSETLGVGRVGINDNFFSLGGDSIVSIRIISKAAEQGLILTVKQIFEHQTLAELSKRAETKKSVSAEQGIVTGDLPLTPIWASFFEKPCISPHHFNQFMSLRISDPLEPRVLRKALEIIISHHDALRLKFIESDGIWSATCADMTPDAPSGVLEVMDLSDMAHEKQPSAIRAYMEELQGSFDLGSGLLLKAVLFLTGEKENHLWLVIHHLAVDSVSWRILIEDFQRLCAMMEKGEDFDIPLKTTSYKEWALRLKEYAASKALIKEKKYWLRQSHPVSMPVDYSFDPLDNTPNTAKTIDVNLSKKETHALLRKAPDIYSARINDILLSALAMTLCKWTGEKKVQIALESHGREELFDDIDLSRTIGWFTSLFPVFLVIENLKNPGEVLSSVKAQLRAIPNGGIGYRMLRYITPDKDIRESFNSLPMPQVIFNYIGQMDEPFDTGYFKLDQLGFSESSDRVRKNLIDIGGGVIDGSLHISISYCLKIHKDSTIQRLADGFANNLREFISGCSATDRETDFVHRDFPQFPELIYLNKGTKDRPIFWIHGGLGGVGAYLKIAQKIKRPFYGIQARGWMTDRTPLRGVHEKASYYRRIIQSVQPEGPYHLGGYSYGGVLAYEITRHLQDLGEPVNSIVMLDSRAYSESESELKPTAFNEKQAMLQAVNIALFETTISEPEKMADVLIHRKELDLSVNDDLFLTQLLENPKTRELNKSKKKTADQIRSVANEIRFSETEKYVLQPLSISDAVNCYYFRNKSGLLLGKLEPYFLIENGNLRERQNYWEKWEKNIRNFHIIDVESSSHMTMLSEPKPFEKILKVCGELYSKNELSKQFLKSL